MKTQPLLSVIVPVYNTERFLSKCLDSIINQSYKNMEIILVDDASPDKCNDIIDIYIKRDKRVRCVRHEVNKGLFQARITGVEASHGEFFAFVDSDDHLSMDYYRLMIKKAVETSSDMVLGDFVNEFENGKCEYLNLDNIRMQDICLTKNSVLSTFMKQQGLFFGWHTVWNKVYRKNLWEKCVTLLSRFSEVCGHLIMTEDIAFSCVFWCYANKVTNIHNAYYYYVRHSGQSVTNGSFDKFKKNITDVAKVFDFFENVLKVTGSFDTYANDFKKFKELYVRFWTDNSKKFIGDEKISSEKLVKQSFKCKSLAFTQENDHFFYRQNTELNPQFSWYENIKQAILNPESSYVSFDIFDTLLLRPLMEPTDLFCLLNLRFNRLCKGNSYLDFSIIRIEAEKSARKRLTLGKPHAEEITLDEIYEEMRLLYSFSPKVIEEMKQAEIDLEIHLSYPRKTGKELFEFAQFIGKKIVLISDMYLSLHTIQQMLDKSGYAGYYKIFLSSEERLTKSTGNLYRKVCRVLSTMPHTIVHIGDNWDVDITRAKELGLKTQLLPKTIDQFKNVNPGVFNGAHFNKIFKSNGKIYNNESALNFIGIRCMLGLVANKIYDNPYNNPFNPNSDFNASPAVIGYYALGMHLYAVADWVLKDSVNRGKRQIHFVSRDGYLPKKAYDILCKTSVQAPKSNYIHISRKATLALQCRDVKEVCSIPFSHNTYSLTPKKILDALLPVITHSVRLKETCLKNGYVYDKCFDSYYEFQSFLKFVADELYNKTDAENYIGSLREYFNKLIGQNDAIFDIGYGGRNELALSKLLNLKIDAYYIHVNSDITGYRSTLSENQIHTFYPYTPSTCAIVREHLFSELAPSCTGYHIKDKGVVPVFEKYNHNYQTNFVTSVMQCAALDFVEDMGYFFGSLKDEMEYSPFYASLPYEHYIHYSTDFDRQIFSASVFEDDLWNGKSCAFTSYWNECIQYHRLKPEIIHERIIEKVVEKQVEVVVEQKTIEYLPLALPAEIHDLYADGMFMALYRKLNKWFPKDGKGRERVKKIVSVFFKP